MSVPKEPPDQPRLSSLLPCLVPVRPSQPGLTEMLISLPTRVDRAIIRAPLIAAAQISVRLADAAVAFVSSFRHKVLGLFNNSWALMATCDSSALWTLFVGVIGWNWSPVCCCHRGQGWCCGIRFLSRISAQWEVLCSDEYCASDVEKCTLCTSLVLENRLKRERVEAKPLDHSLGTMTHNSHVEPHFHVLFWLSVSNCDGHMNVAVAFKTYWPRQISTNSVIV